MSEPEAKRAHADTAPVKLHCEADGVTVTVPRELAKELKWLDSMLGLTGGEDCDKAIPLPDVESSTLNRLLRKLAATDSLKSMTFVDHLLPDLKLGTLAEMLTKYKTADCNPIVEDVISRVAARIKMLIGRNIVPEGGQEWPDTIDYSPWTLGIFTGRLIPLGGARAVSPDGRLVADLDEPVNGTIRLIGSLADTRMRLLKGHTSGVMDAEFSPDSSLLASASADATVRIWSTRTGGCLHVITLSTAVDCVIFSHDGKRVVTGKRDGAVNLWDAQTGQHQLQTMIPGTIHNVIISPDDSLVAAHTSKHLRLFGSRELGEPILSCAISGVKDIRFSPDGKILSACCDKKILLFGTNDGRSVGTLHRPASFGSALSMHRHSPDGRCIAAMANDGCIFMWDTMTHKVTYTIKKVIDTQTFDFHGDSLVLGTRALTYILRRVWWTMNVKPEDSSPAGKVSQNLAKAFPAIKERVPHVSIGLWERVCDLVLRNYNGSPKPDKESASGTETVSGSDSDD